MLDSAILAGGIHRLEDDEESAFSLSVEGFLHVDELFEQCLELDARDDLGDAAVVVGGVIVEVDFGVGFDAVVVDVELVFGGHVGFRGEWVECAIDGVSWEVAARRAINERRRIARERPIQRCGFQDRRAR